VTILEVTDTQVIVGDPLKGKATFTHEEFAGKWRFVGVTLRRNSQQ
jgi:hypothetical protein